MTRGVVLELWLQGGRLHTIAQLLGEDASGIEDAVRMELCRIRDEHQPEPNAAAPADPAPSPAPKAKRAAPSSGRPARRNHAVEMKTDPVRRRVEKALDLTTYPETLRDPSADSQRAVYDALLTGPMVLHDLQVETGLNSCKVFQALQKMRNKNIVRGSEDTPVVWRLA